MRCAVWHCLGCQGQAPILARMEGDTRCNTGFPLAYIKCSALQAWRVYNRSALDFNMFFCSRTAEALERALPDDERAVLPLIWRTGVDDWDTYLCSHFRHIQWHHFKNAACAPVLKDYGI